MSRDSKCVMITGVTRGLGRAMVSEFAKLGWTVAGCGRNEILLSELRKQYPAPHQFLAADLTSEESISAFTNTALSRMGAPDLLLNNGGIINHNAPLWEIGEAEFAEVMDINVKGVASIIRHTVPAMIARGSGIILNFSSYWGRSTAPEVAPYCASKWAIEGLCSALAQELPKGLATAALNPGIINTAMLQKCFGSDAAAYPGAEDWAKSAVPFMASLDTSCNGQQLTAP